MYGCAPFGTVPYGVGLVPASTGNDAAFSVSVPEQAWDALHPITAWTVYAPE